MTGSRVGVSIVGCGYTTLTRSEDRSSEDLVLEACRAAVRDAGIPEHLIDGLNLQGHHDSPVSPDVIARRLGLLNVIWSPVGGMGVEALKSAASAVAAGKCQAALICKVMHRRQPVNVPDIDPITGTVAGVEQFDVPYGLGYTMQKTALVANRWMKRYSISHQEIGHLAVVQRENSLMNPYGYMKVPLSLDDYLRSRWISEPIKLLDCDLPVDGAFAYVLVRSDMTPDMSGSPVRVRGIASSAVPFTNQAHLERESSPESTEWIREFYRQQEIAPEDVDILLLYDGFSYLAMWWLEDLGIVPHGESGNYVAGGDNIRIGSAQPVNTHGGNLSEGRMHGAGHLLEAVQQLRGVAGDRQVAGAGLALVTSNQPMYGSIALLSRP